MFFFFPVGVDYQARRYPVVTFSIMGLCTLIHIVFMVHGWDNPEAQTWWLETFWLIPEKSTWYTYITSAFVHEGLFHLLGNMIFLFLFGSCVEDIIGRWRYLAFYLVGALAASFTYIALTPQHFASEIPLGGASGAISACMGGYVLLLHRSKVEFRWLIFIFFQFWSGTFSLPAWLVLSSYFLKDVFNMWLGLKLSDGDADGGGVAFGAHIGGFVVGMLIIALLKPILRREEALEEAEDEEASAPVIDAEPVAAAAPAYTPVAQVSDEALLLIHDAGNQLGPFTLAQVCDMVHKGHISRQAVYWQDGMSDWRSIQEIA